MSARWVLAVLSGCLLLLAVPFLIEQIDPNLVVHPTDKIGFAFLIGDSITHPKAWQAWVDQAERLSGGRTLMEYRYHPSTAIHNGNVNSTKHQEIDSSLPSFLRGHSTTVLGWSKWGDLGRPLLALVSDLLDDPTVKWIVTVSSTHIPIRPFSELYEMLQSVGDKSLYVPMFGFAELDGWISLDGIKFPKAETWVVWSRRHAEVLRGDLVPPTSFPYSFVFQNSVVMAVGDETYPMYVLAKKLSSDGLKNGVISSRYLFLCWSRQETNEHPLCKDFNESVSRPFAFSSVSIEQWDKLLDSGAMFGRKFLEGCKLNGWGDDVSVMLDGYLAEYFSKH